MDKYNSLVPWQHDVRLPGQMFPVQSEAETRRMQSSTNRNLGGRVLGRNPSHNSAAFSSRNDVSHLIRFRFRWRYIQEDLIVSGQPFKVGYQGTA